MLRRMSTRVTRGVDLGIVWKHSALQFRKAILQCTFLEGITTKKLIPFEKMCFYTAHATINLPI